MTKPWAKLQRYCQNTRSKDYDHASEEESMSKTSAVLERCGSLSSKLDNEESSHTMDVSGQSKAVTNDSGLEEEEEVDHDAQVLEDHLKMMGLESHEEASTPSRPTRVRVVAHGAIWPCCAMPDCEDAACSAPAIEIEFDGNPRSVPGHGRDPQRRR